MSASTKTLPIQKKEKKEKKAKPTVNKGLDLISYPPDGSRNEAYGKYQRLKPIFENLYPVRSDIQTDLFLFIKDFCPKHGLKDKRYRGKHQLKNKKWIIHPRVNYKRRNVNDRLYWCLSRLIEIVDDKPEFKDEIEDALDLILGKFKPLKQVKELLGLT